MPACLKSVKRGNLKLEAIFDQRGDVTKVGKHLWLKDQFVQHAMANFTTYIMVRFGDKCRMNNGYASRGKSV